MSQTKLSIHNTSDSKHNTNGSTKIHIESQQHTVKLIPEANLHHAVCIPTGDPKQKLDRSVSKNTCRVDDHETESTAGSLEIDDLGIGPTALPTSRYGRPIRCPVRFDD